MPRRGNLLVASTDWWCSYEHRTGRFPRRFAPRNDMIGGSGIPSRFVYILVRKWMDQVMALLHFSLLPITYQKYRMRF